MAVLLHVMNVLSRSAAVILIALLSAAAFSFTPLYVRAVNNPIAVADAFAGVEGVPLVVAAPGVLANDDDGDGGGYVPLTAVTLVDPPSIPGLFSLAVDGSVSFTPTDPDFNGDVTFTYTVTDVEAFTSSHATTTMSFAAMNDVPSAFPQSVSTGVDSATSSTLTYTDIDAINTFTFATTSNPQHGAILLDAATGAFTYTPTTSYSGPDEFKWQLFDGSATSTEVTVSITVVADPQIGISFVVVSNTGIIATTSDSALFDGATTTGATTTASVGAHTLSAFPLDGYTTSIGGDCAANGSVFFSRGESYHCVITHTQLGAPPVVVEEKLVANGPISTMGPSFGTISNFNGSVLGASTSTASTTLPELPLGCTPMLSGYFRKDKIRNDSEQVKKLQKFLNEKLQGDIPLSGEFGLSTDAAVRKFQSKYSDQILSPWGISAPTGFVYLTTQRWINLMSCASLDLPMPKLVPYRG